MSTCSYNVLPIVLVWYEDSISGSVNFMQENYTAAVVYCSASYAFVWYKMAHRHENSQSRYSRWRLRHTPAATYACNQQAPSPPLRQTGYLLRDRKAGGR